MMLLARLVKKMLQLLRQLLICYFSRYSKPALYGTPPSMRKWFGKSCPEIDSLTFEVQVEVGVLGRKGMKAAPGARPVGLLFVVHEGVVYILAFGVRSYLGCRARLAIL
jgi:hypothetical protein